ncbi:hypothetical protein NKJ81_20335 [Mesorhizobium sp. M0018]|uniref:hypothetical protein n=1 Tax=Mesorhizobium sp. M0018 TaxID=2956844 RepID=UPI00333BD4BB
MFDVIYLPLNGKSGRAKEEFLAVTDYVRKSAQEPLDWKGARERFRGTAKAAGFRASDGHFRPRAEALDLITTQQLPTKIVIRDVTKDKAEHLFVLISPP